MKKKLTPYGKKVKKRMIDMDIRQAELAMQLGINDAYLHRILYGDRSGKKYVEQINRILGVGVEV